MGQFKLWVAFELQIGFLIEWDRGYSFNICLPFCDIKIGLTDGAKGYSICHGKYY